MDIVGKNFRQARFYFSAFPFNSQLFFCTFFRFGVIFMPVAGVVAEFDPLHLGHSCLLREIRRQMGADTAIVTVLSGSFTQRGEAAICAPLARAEMALRAGADLVLELPVPFAAASAESFARGGVGVLEATGLVDTLCFGSESGDAGRLKAVAQVLDTPEFGEKLRENTAKGISFAQSRAQAIEAICGQMGTEGANDLLATEYLHFWKGEVLAVRRRDDGHNGEHSASAVRRRMLDGDWAAAFALLPDFSREILSREREAGRCPASLREADRAMLYRLRTMTAEEFAAIPDCTEGLEHRLTAAAGQARSLEEFYTLAKSKRYAHARLRRIALRAFLGIRKLPRSVDYLRVLGADADGLKLLRRMKETARVPVITKPAHGKQLPDRAREWFLLDRRADDLWNLCLKEPQPAGTCWTSGPVLII